MKKEPSFDGSSDGEELVLFRLGQCFRLPIPAPMITMSVMSGGVSAAAEAASDNLLVGGAGIVVGPAVPAALPQGDASRTIVSTSATVLTA